MSLILAVEPDRRQAAHLTQVVRQRVGAELILAETTELALASIGNRVPDLILVPALLSPQDDAALAAALRVIATAAHVQMLTIPLFAAAQPKPESRGVLAVFRRSRPAKAAIDGCDPAEFAQQISSYLESAAEERAAATTQPPAAGETSIAHDFAPEVTAEPLAPLLEVEPVIDASEAPTPLEAEPVLEAMAPIEAPEAVEEYVDLDQVPLLVEMPRVDEEEQIELEAEAADDDAIDLSADIDTADAADEITDLEVPVIELATPIIELEAAAEGLATPLELLAIEVEADAAVTVPAVSEPIAEEAVVEAPLEFDVLFDGLAKRRDPIEPCALGTWRSWTSLEGTTAEAADAPVPARVVERAVERPADRPEWVQLIESLRVDVERRRERPLAAADAVCSTPAKTAPTRPVQDEWGLFDPAQCGFAALLEKLDEITHGGDQRPRPSA